MNDLISRKALFKLIENAEPINLWWITDLITNAPTVQREGWVSVPIEPTEEMIIALKSALKEWKNDEECYKAMLAAAPTDTE